MAIARPIAALALVVAMAVTAAAEPQDVRPAAGRSRTVAARRTAVAPVIDGAIREPAWATAAAAEQFWLSDKQRAPTDQTRVVVLYDDVALYVAFTCLDAKPDLINASQTARGADPGLDDRVTVALDPLHNHRSITRFTVSARGTPSMEFLGGRLARRTGAHEWQAAARRTPSGWTAEMAIPFALLEVRAGADTMGVNFGRYQHRAREWSDWADVTPRRRPDQAGHLTGVQLPTSAVSRQLAVVQYVSSDVSAAAVLPGGGQTPTAGTGERWGGTLTSLVSAPDFGGNAPLTGAGFSQTDSFVGDRRRFFQQGGSFFGDREVFNTNAVGAFDIGVTTIGRVDDYQMGLLATSDAAGGMGQYVGRVVREIGPGFNLSATMAGTRADEVDNSTLQLQAGGRVGRHLRIEGNLVRTSNDASAEEGLRRRAAIAYQRANWSSGGWADRTDPGYATATGVVAADVIGTVGRGAYGGYSRALTAPWIRRTTASVAYDIRDTTTGLRQRETTTVYAGAEMAANIQLNAGMTVGSYRPRGSADGQWSDALNDDRYYLASAFYNSPTGQYGYGAQYARGVAASQAYGSLAPSLWLAPNPRLSLAYSFERAEYDRVRHQHVLSGTWDISTGQSLNARWIDDHGGYYRVSYRRNLADTVDAFGVYSSDPYDPGRVNVQLVWTISPVGRR